MPTMPVRDALITTPKTISAYSAPRRTRRNDFRFGEPDQRDRRPQQQRAQVVGLAQVADRSAGKPRMRDQVAIGPVGHEDLHESNSTLSTPGDQQRPAKRAEQLIRLAAALRGRAAQSQHDRARQHADVRQRQAQGCLAHSGAPRGDQAARRMRSTESSDPRCAAVRASSTMTTSTTTAPQPSTRGCLIEQRCRRRNVVGQQCRDDGGEDCRCDQPCGRSRVIQGSESISDEGHGVASAPRRIGPVAGRADAISGMPAQRSRRRLRGQSTGGNCGCLCCIDSQASRPSWQRTGTWILHNVTSAARASQAVRSTRRRAHSASGSAAAGWRR